MFILHIFQESWHLFLDASVYIIFGLLISGLLRVFLSPQSVAKHLGHGRFVSVFKAAILGIPIPLCSCGVLPAAISLKKQGANNGATAAFLISTPESGVDSMAITYALLDPIMTVIRPVAAFIMGVVAGISENLFAPKKDNRSIPPDVSCPIDGCCDGKDCSPEAHRQHHGFWEKIGHGFKYAFTDVWGDLAAWFFIGLLLAGIISAAVPDEVLGLYLGGGISAMLLMLVVGIPLYICATASTPIAAALILKGVSPGAALVFLLAGPATNLASLTVLANVLGKRATAIYLGVIALFSLLFGLAVDWIYQAAGISLQAVVAQADAEMPIWIAGTGAAVLIFFSIKPVTMALKGIFKRGQDEDDHLHGMDELSENTPAMEPAKPT